MKKTLRTPIVALGAALCFGNAQPTSLRTIRAVVTSKADQTPFLARMATATERVIFTSATATDQGVLFHVPRDKGVYVAEFHANLQQVVGEFYRYANIVAFTADSFADASAKLTAAGEHIHPHAISNELTRPQSDVSVGKILTRPLQGSNSLDTANIAAHNLQTLLEEFTGTRPTTINGQTVTLGERMSKNGREQAFLWLSERYTALGFQVSPHVYGSGKNFIAEKQGSDPSRIILISSHYDSMSTVGADDDGSGTISALAIAEALATHSSTATLRFVAFDQEELGLLGSKALAKSLNQSGDIKNIAAVVNLEMTSYDSDNDGKFHSIDCNENSSAEISAALDEILIQSGSALKKVAACTNRSDHASFWAYNRPAIVISQNYFGGDPNPCYHQRCDTTAKSNWIYMESITRAAALLVQQLAN